MDKISVIIAVYNTKKYLARCVQSILNQTYKNIEVILVDDGSTDGSGKICDELAKEDARVKVIHKENEGASVARNAALKYATGEYVSFIDSDDKICEKAYEISIKLMKKFNADMVKYNSCTKEDKLSSVTEIEDAYVLSTKEVTDKILVDEYGSQLWQYIFKKELWENILQPKGRLAQDMMVLHHVSSKANKVLIIPHNFYFYFQDRKDNVSNGNKKNVRGTVDRAVAYWMRVGFCENTQIYADMLDKCLKKAIEFSASAFCKKEFFKNDKYQEDRKTFRDNVKRHKKEVFSNSEISIAHKVCVLFIIYTPKLIPTIYMFKK